MKRTVGIIAAASAVLLGAGPARAVESIESQTLSPRLWYVDWQFGPEDLGSAPFVMLNWNVQFTKWHFQVLAGYGEGWESDAISDEAINASENARRFFGPDPADRRQRDTLLVESRVDLQWQIARKFSLSPLHQALNLPWNPGIVYVGAAYHYVEFEFDAPLGAAEYFYHGPEALLGFTQPLFADGLSLRVSATWLPHAWITTEEFVTDSETTDGIQYDVGLAYSTLDGAPLHIGVGYRDLTMNESGDFAEDQFAGFYAEVGVRF